MADILLASAICRKLIAASFSLEECNPAKYLKRTGVTTVTIEENQLIFCGTIFWLQGQKCAQRYMQSKFL
jgi:hypothetical protein